MTSSESGLRSTVGTTVCPFERPLGVQRWLFRQFRRIITQTLQCGPSDLLIIFAQDRKKISQSVTLVKRKVPGRFEMFLQLSNSFGTQRKVSFTQTAVKLVRILVRISWPSSKESDERVAMEQLSSQTALPLGACNQGILLDLREGLVVISTLCLPVSSLSSRFATTGFSLRGTSSTGTLRHVARPGYRWRAITSSS